MQSPVWPDPGAVVCSARELFFITQQYVSSEIIRAPWSSLSAPVCPLFSGILSNPSLTLIDADLGSVASQAGSGQSRENLELSLLSSHCEQVFKLLSLLFYWLTVSRCNNGFPVHRWHFLNIAKHSQTWFQSTGRYHGSLRLRNTKQTKNNIFFSSLRL